MAFSYYFYSMKYSQTIGIILCLALFYCTTQPLVIIDSQHLVITGWKTTGTSLGQPGKFMLYLGMLSLVLFALPYIWAKRLNIVLGALLLAWSFRTFLVLGTCQMGECPEKQWALYACVILSAGILLLSFLPKIDVSKK